MKTSYDSVKSAGFGGERVRQYFPYRIDITNEILSFGFQPTN